MCRAGYVYRDRVWGVKLETVEVTWGTSIAALQANKIDIQYMLDATPERAQAVDFPQAPLLYYSLAVLARDDLPVAQWSDLDKPSVRMTNGIAKASRSPTLLL